MITASLAVEDKVLSDELVLSLNAERVQIDCSQPQVSDLTPFLESLHRAHPDLVFLDVGSLRVPIGDALGKVRAVAPESFLVAVNTRAEAGQLLDCFHGSANEYLIPPVTEGIRRVVAKRVEGMRKTELRHGRVLAFLSAKGGCGATTVACHVAAAMAGLRHRILLADFDMGSGMVGFLMGTESRYSIADAFANTHRLDDSYWSALVTRREPGVDVIAAPASVEARRSAPPEAVKQVLEYAKRSYDWALVDLGRGLNPFSMAAIGNAEELCLVVEPHVAALRQAKSINQILMDSGYAAERIHLVLNRVERRMPIDADEMQKLLGVPIFAALRDREDELETALSQGHLAASGTELGHDFERLARKITGERQEAKRGLWPFGWGSTK